MLRQAQHDERPRSGGYPDVLLTSTPQLTWVPAFAGTTVWFRNSGVPPERLRPDGEATCVPHLGGRRRGDQLTAKGERFGMPRTAPSVTPRERSDRGIPSKGLRGSGCFVVQKGTSRLRLGVTGLAAPAGRACRSSARRGIATRASRWIGGRCAAIMLANERSDRLPAGSAACPHLYSDVCRRGEHVEAWRQRPP